MQLCLTVTVVVFVILKVTSRSVSGCDVDVILKENDLKPNPLKKGLFIKKLWESSYEGVFNIDREKKSLSAGTNYLLLHTNETKSKWTSFRYSQALVQFIEGSPIKFMLYDQQGNYTEQYLGNKRTTACQNIACTPIIILPANSYFKKESFREQGCDKYTLYTTTVIPSKDQPTATFNDDELSFSKV